MNKFKTTSKKKALRFIQDKLMNSKSISMRLRVRNRSIEQTSPEGAKSIKRRIEEIGFISLSYSEYGDGYSATIMLKKTKESQQFIKIFKN